MKKLLFKWGELKATFWFVPVIIIISSVLLSMVLVYTDGHIDISQDGIGRYFFVNSSDSARSILSTISGAMMGVAGTVFSITLVALTLASSQFGPRLIKKFMYVRLNQVVLGAYISTYLYCLLVLNAVKGGDDYTFIPSLSILVAILAAITNIVLLIVFIHQIAVSLQADKVVSDITEFIAKQVKTLFPEKVGDTEGIEAHIDVPLITSGYQNRSLITCTKSGYLQYIGRASLLEIIVENNALLELYYRPGDHLVEGIEIGLLYFNGSIEKDLVEKINRQFEIGKIKTAQQDMEYSIHQMVEIAARALSPGVNDPFTAIACIDNLTSTMCYLAEAKFPSKYEFDEDENLRVIANILDFEGVLDAAFNQIRQYSAGSTAVIIRLMEALITVYEFTRIEPHKNAVIKHAEMVFRLGKETIKEENDLNDLKNRANQILTA
jgi:uncharacterized membrane protein